MLRYVNTSLAFFAVIQSVPPQPLSRRRGGGEQVHVDIGLVERELQQHLFCQDGVKLKNDAEFSKITPDSISSSIRLSFDVVKSAVPSTCRCQTRPFFVPFMT